MIVFRKIFILCLLSLCWMGVQCQSPKSVIRIDYTTLTRGYQKQIVLTHDSVTLHVEGREENKDVKRALTKAEWTSLVSALKNVKLAEIPNLPSPSMKRAYDGARHSTITLTTKDQKTLAHAFDNEDAHAKLQPLMKAILKIEEATAH
ncbi:MAG TPA: hypothetical protein VIN08_14320 [Ohtaekwangia sp.]|uniref:hypothetical protein n=1 Tax=Ohtaekwangia sp. TaxID=2066019 RepID=UPI002F9351BC